MISLLLAWRKSPIKLPTTSPRDTATSGRGGVGRPPPTMNVGQLNPPLPRPPCCLEMGSVRAAGVRLVCFNALGEETRTKSHTRPSTLLMGGLPAYTWNIARLRYICCCVGFEFFFSVVLTFLSSKDVILPRTSPNAQPHAPPQWALMHFFVLLPRRAYYTYCSMLNAPLNACGVSLLCRTLMHCLAQSFPPRHPPLPHVHRLAQSLQPPPSPPTPSYAPPRPQLTPPPPTPNRSTRAPSTA